MMKAGYLLHLGIGSLLVLPAVSMQGGRGALGREGLEQALQETIRALEDLVGIERSLAQGDAGAVERLLSVTQMPRLDARQRDQTLHVLRTEVSRLQQDLDEEQARLLTGATAGPGADGGARPAHTGLDDSQHALISAIPPPVPGSTPSSLAGTTPHSFETEGFTADPVRHARAYYRAGRYVEGLRLLEKVEGSISARYWTGRCLERLGKTDRALAAYQECVDWPEPDPIAERARLDLEFLQWKRKFETQGGDR